MFGGIRDTLSTEVNQVHIHSLQPHVHHGPRHADAAALPVRGPGGLSHEECLRDSWHLGATGGPTSQLLVMGRKPECGANGWEVSGAAPTDQTDGEQTN